MWWAPSSFASATVSASRAAMSTPCVLFRACVTRLSYHSRSVGCPRAFENVKMTRPSAAAARMPAESSRNTSGDTRSADSTKARVASFQCASTLCETVALSGRYSTDGNTGAAVEAGADVEAEAEAEVVEAEDEEDEEDEDPDWPSLVEGISAAERRRTMRATSSSSA